MKLLTKIFILVTILFLGCSNSSSSNFCDNPQSSFTNIQEAERVIINSTFEYEDNLRTSQSSWVTKAIYKSCDNSTGYFIYYTNKGNTYLHSNVPIRIWKGFKNASSKGNYINENLKNKYQF